MKLISGSRVDVTEVIELGSGITLEQNASGIPKLLASGAGGGLGANVTESPYNATGDGATDDTAAIQAAIDAVFAAGGGIVFFPAGTYLVSQLSLKSNVWLFGESWASIIKCKDANHSTVTSGTSTGSNGARTLNDTGAAFTLNGHKNQTVHITGGTGSGQKRTITHAETTTQLAISDDWATIPDGTSTYSVYDGKHTIILATPASTAYTVVTNLQFQGNKANQTALVDCFYYSNLGWSDANHDSRHLLDNVLVDDYSGSGLTRSTAVREMRIESSHFNRCDGYGSRNLLDHTDSGASDCKFMAVVVSKCGLSGFSCGAGHDLLVDCKSFGNGLLNVSGNAAGFLLFIDGVHLSSCESQENFQSGFRLLLAAKSCGLTSCNADANGSEAVLIDGTTDAFVQVTVQSTSGLAYQTANALKYVNSATRNTVAINAQSAQLSGTLTTSDSVFNTDSIVIVNNVLYGTIYTRLGTDGSTTDDHLRWGKLDAPASGNPEYRIRTNADAEADCLIESNDGTTVRTFIRLDHANNVIQLGHAAGGSPFGEVRIMPSLLIPDITSGTTQFGDATHRWGAAFFGAAVECLYGSTNADRTHFFWGRASSPASNNPAYYLKTSSHSTPRGRIEGFDGTTTRTFIEMDGSSGGVTYQGVSPIFSSTSGDTTVTSAGNVVVPVQLNITSSLNHTGTNWRLGNTTFGTLGASPGPWSTSGITTSRTVNSSLTLAQLIDVVGTLVNDLFARGVIA